MVGRNLPITACFLIIRDYLMVNRLNDMTPLVVDCPAVSNNNNLRHRFREPSGTGFQSSVFSEIKVLLQNKKNLEHN